MTHRSSGRGWLTLGIVSGAAALLVLGLGLYSIRHTHHNLQIHRDIVARRMQELDQLKPALHLPQNQAKAEQLWRMIDNDRRYVYEYESTRDLAFLIAGSSVVPGALALVFFAIFAKKRKQRTDTEISA